MKRNPSYVIYLVGDAGNSEAPDTVPVLKHLKKVLSKESERSAILFLGDNIYPSGMPARPDTGQQLSARKFRIASRERENAEYRLTTQLDVLKDFKGQRIFVPGNHDWKHDSVGVKEQQKFVNDYLNAGKDIKKDYFLPKDFSRGPVMVDLSDSITALIIDSHQVITQWDTQVAGGGTIGERFTTDFSKMIDAHRSKNIVVAMHHPPYTYGPHGGRYSLKQYAFPVTELEKVSRWAYIPSPTLGLLMLIPGVWSKIFGGVLAAATIFYPLERTYLIRPKQDVRNRYYRRFKNAMLTGLLEKRNAIFVSGHEHTLQYVENDDHHFIVSGSGSKSNPVGMGKGSLFSSASVGYSTLSFFEGGETWVTFYGFKKGKKSQRGDESMEVIFQKKIKDKI
nr:metallophosphoesterase [uncultured Dyadobacter sp.]